MFSRIAQDVARLYTERHKQRQANQQDVYGSRPYGNFGYWPREGMTVEEACDALTELVATTAGMGPGDRVLEVGCGYGAGAVFYTQRFQPASVTGIDVTEVRVNAARAFIAANGLADKIQVCLGDATALPFEAGAFTKVIAMECAFHFHTRQDFFREAARVLTPGGALAMTDIIPRRGVSKEEFMARVYPIGTDASLNVPENVYDAEVYAACLRDAGFEAVRVESITAWSLPCFAAHVERLGQRTEGPRGTQLQRSAQIYRELIEAGLDYVLVGARESTS